MPITITLTPDQQRDLESQVAAGHFPSVEAAVKIALDNLLPGDDTDLDWARPLVDEARADAANGDVIPGQEAHDLLDRRVADLQGRR
jgi:Arc/MetJ-type ribon-helix-helix transcriptional regulator